MPALTVHRTDARSAPYANEDLRPQQRAPSGGRAPAGSTGSVAVDLGLGALLGVMPLPVHRGSASPSSSGALARLLNCTPLADPAAFSGGSERCSRQEVQERLRSPPLSLALARPFSSQVYAEAEVIAATMDLDARECAGEEKEGHKEGGTASSLHMKNNAKSMKPRSVIFLTKCHFFRARLL